MKIKVRTKQLRNNKLNFDKLITFNSEEDYLAALQKAFRNWKAMYGKYAIIESYSEMIAYKRGFYAITSNSYDFELWEIIKVNYRVDFS